MLIKRNLRKSNKNAHQRHPPSLCIPLCIPVHIGRGSCLIEGEGRSPGSEGARVVFWQLLQLLTLGLALIAGDCQGVGMAHGHLGGENRERWHFKGQSGASLGSGSLPSASNSYLLYVDPIQSLHLLRCSRGLGLVVSKALGKQERKSVSPEGRTHLECRRSIQITREWEVGALCTLSISTTAFCPTDTPGKLCQKRECLQSDCAPGLKQYHFLRGDWAPSQAHRQLRLAAAADLWSLFSNSSTL